MADKVEKSAKLIIEKLLSVKSGENVLIIADDSSEMEMVNALFKVAFDVGGNPVIAIIRSKWPSHTTLPKTVHGALNHAQVVIGITKSTGAPSYDAVVAKLLRDKRIRYMSMVLRPLENWISGAALADYEKVYSTALKLAEVFEGRKEIKVTTELGTDISASIEGSRVIIEAGFATKPGESAAFSDGEVSFTPVEGTANGVVVVDGPIALIGKPSEPIKLIVENGVVTEVIGGGEADKLKEMISKVKNLNNFAEFGFGVNPEARLNGFWQEEKKALGTMHIALGDNIYYGGNVKCEIHMDMVVYKPTVSVDGVVIIEKGELKI
ncbi:MAG: leucyl aminopeptidase [Candidatus Methanomethylicota archaeon]|uniref:Leucyl aminopeptidase n=1 Tax=Thermoproteota archaeon TaxID=2056631 RepID=A0A497EUV4_9CREN|nr:MAG: leucyl aminopeptidase [Candidatus Verstraetearchaeota archaeon]